MSTQRRGSSARSIGRQSVFDARHHLTVQTYLKHRIDQDPSCQVLNGALEQSTLERGDGVRNDDDQSCVQFHLAEKPNEIDAVVGDESKFISEIRSASSQSGLPLRPRWLTWDASNPAA
jgi:hypothetical protein